MRERDVNKEQLTAVENLDSVLLGTLKQLFILRRGIWIFIITSVIMSTILGPFVTEYFNYIICK